MFINRSVLPLCYPICIMHYRLDSHRHLQFVKKFNYIHTPYTRNVHIVGICISSSYVCLLKFFLTVAMCVHSIIKPNNIESAKPVNGAEIG